MIALSSKLDTLRNSAHGAHDGSAASGTSGKHQTAGAVLLDTTAVCSALLHPPPPAPSLVQGAAPRLHPVTVGAHPGLRREAALARNVPEATRTPVNSEEAQLQSSSAAAARHI
jgi:hypothetical protein